MSDDEYDDRMCDGCNCEPAKDEILYLCEGCGGHTCHSCAAVVWEKGWAMCWGCFEPVCRSCKAGSIHDKVNPKTGPCFENDSDAEYKRLICDECLSYADDTY